MLGPRRVHGGVAGVRAGHRRRVLDRDASRPGTRCGDHAARRPVDRDEHVQRGRRAQQGAGIWGGLGAGGATVGLIAGGLLTRYAGWQYIFYLNVPIGVAALLLAPRIVPESRLASTRRRFDAARRDRGHGWAGAPGRRDLPGAAVRLGRHADPRAARGVGGVCWPRSCVIESRVEEPILPLRIFRLRTLAGANAGRAAAGRQLLRVHLRRHAVHAAGAALQRAPDRGRVAGRVADVDRARRPLAVAGDPRRGQGRDGDRDDADRRRRALGHPGRRSTVTSWPTSPARWSSPARGPRSRSSRSRSPRSPAWPSTRPDSRPGC